MNRYLTLVLITLIFASPASASTKKKSNTKTAAPTTQVTSPTTEPPHTSSASSAWKLSASAGLGSIGSKFHLGVMGKAETPKTIQGTPLKVGGEIGFLLGPSSPTSLVIPMMGIATYAFPNNGGLNAYLGLGLGLSIYYFSAHNASDTSIYFTGLLKPGVKLSEKYYAELPFGAMAGGFMILPSVGMHL